MYIKSIFLATMFISLYGMSFGKDIIELKGKSGAGIVTRAMKTQHADQSGVLNRYELKLPAYTKGIYSSSDGNYDYFQIGGNRVLPWFFTPSTLKRLFEEPAYGIRDWEKHKLNIKSGGMRGISRYGFYLMLELADGQCMAILPLASTRAVSWLHVGEDGVMIVETANYGSEPVSGDVPILAYGVGGNANEAAWKLFSTLRKNKEYSRTFRLRYEKEFPNIFSYLGWCTWEEYKTSISAELIERDVAKLKNLPLPIRYMIIDDGHHTFRPSFGEGASKRALSSFAPNEKFPNGFAPLLSMRQKGGLEWMGLWHNFNGYWGGFSAENEFSPEINACLRTIPETKFTIPKGDKQCIEKIYDAYLGRSAKDGFDFLKVDWQAANLYMSRFTENAARQAFYTSRVVDDIAHRDFNNVMINCMAQNNVVLLNTYNVNITRSSIDYKLNNMFMAKEHLMQSYHNALYLCPTVWGDHDMFHSSDKVCGKIMAVSKALSGGPVYLSDAPEAIEADMVFPLCYSDGRLVRPLAPATTLQRSVFTSPMNDGSVYYISAPLAGNTAAVVAYNLSVDDLTVAGSINSDDYAFTGTTIQPYTGKWSVPREGLYVYDYFAGSGQALQGEYKFELKGFDNKYLLMTPVVKGWSVIGRTDKYLSPASVENITYTDNAVSFSMYESGDVTFWMKDGAPYADGVAFDRLGEGLWKAKLPQGIKNYSVTIHKKPKKTEVLVVTGGHKYDTLAFHNMFARMTDLNCTYMFQPEVQEYLTYEKSARWDVVLFYDFWFKGTPESKAALADMVAKGRPVLFLHHSICNYDDWSEWLNIAGVKYVQRTFTGPDGKEYPRSKFKHDCDMRVHVLPDEGSLRGIADFDLVDEYFWDYIVSPNAKPFVEITCEGAKSNVAWRNTYGKGKPVTFILGHGQTAYENPGFAEILYRLILSQAGRKQS